MVLGWWMMMELVGIVSLVEITNVPGLSRTSPTPAIAVSAAWMFAASALVPVGVTTQTVDWRAALLCFCIVVMGQAPSDTVMVSPAGMVMELDEPQETATS